MEVMTLELNLTQFREGALKAVDVYRVKNNADLVNTKILTKCPNIKI